MERTKINGIEQDVSRIALGTWAIGGWLWGGADDNLSVKTIRTAIDKQINIIDTAPVYGFGKSEKIVGKAIKEYGNRENIVIATKAGLEWKNGKVFRNTSAKRIRQEIENSLKRLQTDYIDIYQIHWPDKKVATQETAGEMLKLFEEGKIRAIGVSNYNPFEMEDFMKYAPIHTAQPPYNIFEKNIEQNIIPFCMDNNIQLLFYGVLCRGLLSGRMTLSSKFEGDDLRRYDPKFKPPRYEYYLKAVQKLSEFSGINYNRSVLELSVRWLLDKSEGIALWGARRPEQLKNIDQIFGWNLDKKAISKIDQIVSTTVISPVGPEFMAPPK